MVQVINLNILELKNELEILHVIIHRNKNQHRQALWWKYLSIIHRNLKNLVMIPQKLGDEKPYRKKRMKDRCSVSFDHVERCEYLVYKVIPKGYMAFQRLIAQKQYVPLALVLVACIAKIWNILQKDENIFRSKKK